jgi:hypothetical protein
LLTCTEPTRAIQIVDLRQMEVPPPPLPPQPDHSWRRPRWMMAQPLGPCHS